MAITKEKKVQILKDLEEKFARAKAVYFAENKGLSVKESSALRRSLREQNVDLVVAKKTLMKIAAKNTNLPELNDEVLTGPIAAIIGYEDAVLPSKLVKDFGKTADERIVLTGGILDGKILNQAETIQIASLPTKQELLAKLVGSMKAPISGFHGALHGLLSKFVRTVDAVRAQKA